MTISMNNSTSVSISISNYTRESGIFWKNQDTLSFFVVLMSSFCVGTIVGNFLVIVAILTNNKQRKKLSNRFILSLALADFCVGCFILPFSIAKIKNHYIWSFGVTFCKIWVTSDVGFVSVSIYNLIGISFDRYYAVYYPIRYVTKRSSWMVNLMILFSWIMFLVVSLPMHINKPGYSNWGEILNVSTISETRMFCLPPENYESRGWVLYAAVILFFVPAIILIIVHTLIYVKSRSYQDKNVWKARNESQMEKQSNLLSSRSTTQQRSSPIPILENTEGNTLTLVSHRMSIFDKKDIDELGNKNEKNKLFSIRQKKTKELSRAEKKLKKAQAAQNKITAMMTVVIGAFVICWIPFSVMFILFPFNSGISSWLIAHGSIIEIVIWAGYLNSFLNPLIYAIMNKPIRMGITNIFTDTNKFFCQKRN